jgi:hypothetical protein
MLNTGSKAEFATEKLTIVLVIISLKLTAPNLFIA